MVVNIDQGGWSSDGWQVTVTTLQHRRAGVGNICFFLVRLFFRAGDGDGRTATTARTARTVLAALLPNEIGQVTPRAPAAAGDRRQANIVTHDDSVPEISILLLRLPPVGTSHSLAASTYPLHDHCLLSPAIRACCTAFNPKCAKSVDTTSRLKRNRLSRYKITTAFVIIRSTPCQFLWQIRVLKS